MTNSSVAELYFIVGMMVLILIFSFAATYFFFRQFKRERADRDQTKNNEE